MARSSREDRIVQWLTVAATPLFVLAVIHAVKTRTVDDFIRYPLYVAVPIGVVGIAIAVAVWWQAKRPSPTVETWVGLCFAPVILYLVGAMYYAVAATLKDIYLWLQSPSLSRNEAIGVGVALTLVLGAALFYFRLRLRSVYGMTEALVGMAVAGHRVSTEIDRASSDPGFYLAVLTAGVYLVVRGFDNIHQGAKEPASDPVAARVRRWIKRVGDEGGTAAGAG